MRGTMEEETAGVDTTSKRFRLALILLVMNYVLGAPMLVALEALAIYLESEFLALYIAPGLYAASWLLLGLAIWIGGPPAVTEARQWLRVRWAALRGQSN